MRKKKLRFSALRYHGGNRNNAAARSQFLAWRRQQDPPIPERCDNENCKFFSEPLLWNGSPFKPILEHVNGVNTDNRPKNLQFLCPNCDAQNTATRGGANKGRVIKSSGGFALVDRDGTKHYTLPVETVSYQVTFGDVGSSTSAQKE